MTDDARRPPGRPRTDDPHTRVCVWLSTAVHDDLIAEARRREQSVSATIRERLVKSISLTTNQGLPPTAEPK